MNMNLAADVVGNIGVVMFLAAFFLLQQGKLAHTNLWYLLLNLCGAILLLMSLWVHWNLSAFILEAIWGLISMWGILQHHILPKLR
jgi:hypothetical protein